MIPRLGDGNDEYAICLCHNANRLENDSPSRGRKPDCTANYYIFGDSLENDSTSRGRKLYLAISLYTSL